MRFIRKSILLLKELTSGNKAGRCDKKEPRKSEQGFIRPFDIPHNLFNGGCMNTI